jgi:hypothetical protein
MWQLLLKQMSTIQQQPQLQQQQQQQVIEILFIYLFTFGTMYMVISPSKHQVRRLLT